MNHSAYGAPLPAGMRSRLVDNGNGLTMHVLEAGHGDPSRPRVLLLHGFPELAHSWRKIAPALADAGYHVIAPDQRGYGATTGWDPDFDGDLGSFRIFNLVRDILGLLFAMGHSHVDAVVGHDFGAIVAPWCTLIRPDVFRAMVLMSAPFAGAPALPLAGEAATRPAAKATDIHADLAALSPPRKHYQWYYSSREADGDMRHCPQGLHEFLRAYFQVKSADWTPNSPFPLKAWSAGELARLPRYYIMDLHRDMAQIVAEAVAESAPLASSWLAEEDLRIYTEQFARTGFQGALNWYRCRTSGRFDAELQLYSGRRIEVPSCFIAGRADWGIHQSPGALARMCEEACTRMWGCHLLDGAGHWVQQEQPEAVSRLLLEFLGAAQSVSVAG